MRVWVGPMPEVICLIHGKMTAMMYTFLFCTVVSITFARFVFICVWRSMRTMNDDLLVRIIISQISFLCLLHSWPIDGHIGSEVNFYPRMISLIFGVWKPFTCDQDSVARSVLNPSFWDGDI